MINITRTLVLSKVSVLTGEAHSTITYSKNGGESFETLASYSRIHSDHHAILIHPEDASFMIDGNGGGLAISHDYGKHWRVPENLLLAQFYSILYYVHGGMQGNGSWRGLNRVCRSRGVRNVYWEKIRFGDGFDMVPNSENSRYGCSIWKCGNLMRYIAKTGDFEHIRPKPDSVTDPTEGQFYFNWNGAVAQSPHDPNTVYYGKPARAQEYQNSWMVISLCLTRKTPSGRSCARERPHVRRDQGREGRWSRTAVVRWYRHYERGPSSSDRGIGYERDEVISVGAKTL